MRNINSKHILISEKNNLAAVYNFKTLKELHFSHNTYQTGSIYIGIVDTILTNIQAAFIKLSSYEKNGFIHINSLLNKSELLKNPNQNKRVLIQIIKEPTSNKGPNLSTNIGLIGSYLILLPFESSIKVSKKIIEPKEKIYLKGILTLLKPIKFGVLIKKEATKISSNNLKQDFLSLQKKWRRIKVFIKNKKIAAPCLIDNKSSFVQKLIKKLYDINVSRISTEHISSAWEIYHNLIYLGHQGNWNPIIVEYFNKNKSLIKTFYLDFSLYYILQPKIDLMTGGSIFIEKTEALTAVDINSGSFNQRNNSRSTILWINCEASTEITRQLMLRNLGGIIVVDFIDMEFQKDQLTLLNHLNTTFKKYNSEAKIIQLSEIGLVEITKKRKGQNVYDAFGYKCARCEGLGYYLLLPTFKTGYKSLFSFETIVSYSRG